MTEFFAWVCGIIVAWLGFWFCFGCVLSLFILIAFYYIWS